MSSPSYLFISPHLDDVALSCGGYVRRLTSAGERVIILTVVTADPPPGARLSKLARRNHAAWRLGDAPFEPRRREDIAAIQLLGAQYVHLGLPDMMYRCDVDGRPIYTQLREVSVAQADWRQYASLLRQSLAKAIEAYDQPVRMFCPLTIGGHVDHIIVRHVVESLCDSQHILYYEDYPYADQPAAVQHVLKGQKTSAAWRSNNIELAPPEVEARIAAVACYKSQVPGLFPSVAEQMQEIMSAHIPLIGRSLVPTPDLHVSNARMAARLRAYMARAGGERYWQRS